MVKFSPYLLPFLSVLTGALADYPVPGDGCPAPHKETPKAVYFTSNNKRNSVVALKVNEDGTLSEGSVALTEGHGGQAINANGEPNGPDALTSQHALAVSEDILVSVNAGSSTLSLFKINKENPTELTLIGTPVHTLGDFPNTVAVSAKLSLACVANTGARAGIACFKITKKGLHSVDNHLRPFELEQSTPPSTTKRSFSDIIFSEDQSALLAFVKGDMATNRTALLAVYPIGSGHVSKHGIMTDLENVSNVFGVVQIPGTHNILATDPSRGAALIKVGKDGKGETLKSIDIEGQMATCWAAYSPASNTVFVTDGAVNRLVDIDADGNIITKTPLENGNGAMFDMVAAGDFVYALSPGNRTAMAVVHVGGGEVRQVQNFLPQGVIDNPLTPQGVAFY
ncbi:hypothetical protein FQN55_002974 [Onygenales sp. PD_40]|nr:hypothetical protein FQN55_002974 [Onygenales sp. PD_40]KAK2775272.1 hypothetical protein FQN53_003252 [Emmonsiellopsis sp. PD_33]